MEATDCARKFFEVDGDARFYVPGRFVAVSVENFNRSVQTQGTGFKTIARKGLVPLVVVYPNERYWPGMTVWVESDVTKMVWASGDCQYTLPNGPKFGLLPEELVRMVTRS